MGLHLVALRTLGALLQMQFYMSSMSYYFSLSLLHLRK